MHNLSLWASRHFWLARLLIIGAYVVITRLAFFIGSTLQLLDISLPLLLFYGSVAAFIAVFIMYPDKLYSQHFRNFYVYRKTCDSILLATTFLFMVCIGNRPESLLHVATAPAAAAIPNTVKPVEGSNIQPVHGKLSKKALKQAFVKKLKQLRRAYKDTSTGGKVALIILAVVVALVLLYLVAALSCSIACSGAEGAAIVVGILGGGAVIFFLIRVIRRIVNGPRNKPEKPSTT